MGYVTRSGWLETDSGPVPVRVREPHLTLAALVVVPPFALESAIAIRAMHALSDRAARAGVLTYLMSLTPDGDSAPVQAGADLAKLWGQHAGAVITEARRRVPGRPVNVIGVRLGAAVAAAVHTPTDTHAILWEPLSGSSFLTQQRLRRALEREVPCLPIDGEGLEIFGVTLSGAHVDSIRGLAGAPGRPQPGLSVRVEPDRTRSAAWFEHADFTATVPCAEIDALVAALELGKPGKLGAPADSRVATLTISGRSCTETFVSVGPHRLSGVRTEPADLPATGRRPGGVLFTAQGPEQRCGPGALWTTIARELAGDGVTSLRCDRRGLGDHTDVDDPYPPVPYTDEAIADVAAAVQALRVHSPGPIIGVSSCAGAWLLLRARTRTPIDLVLGTALSYFGVDLEWLAGPEARTWIGRPDGAPRVVTTTQAGATRPHAVAAESRRLVGRALRRLPRVAESVADLREARQTGGLGRPVLRGRDAARGTLLLFGARDFRRFAHVGGTVLHKRGRRQRCEPELDHSLLTASARRRLLEIVQKETRRVVLNP